jgi:hypothetical protein
MNKTEVKEKLIEIGTRVIGKGDTWKVQGVEKIQPSLTDALETWFQSATIKPKAFRLDLALGRLYAILTEEIEIPKPEIKRYNIYGDY